MTPAAPFAPFAVVLAAGASSRMGRPKALCTLSDGRTFVGAIAGTALAAGCGELLVVLGPPHADAIRPALPTGARVVFNPAPERGMLSSVQAGISALPPGTRAALIWPVDIPLVSPETVRAVLDADPGRLVIPTYGGRGGHPIRIPADRFAGLHALDPSRGLRGLIEADPGAVVRLAVDDPSVLVDVDTPEDLGRLR